MSLTLFAETPRLQRPLSRDLAAGLIAAVIEHVAAATDLDVLPALCQALAYGLAAPPAALKTPGDNLREFP